MTNPDRNAAIYYVSDGYDPETKGINGRRVAGASFLAGFLDHADVDEFVSVSPGSKAQAAFADLVRTHRPGTGHRALSPGSLDRLAPVGTMYFPAPNFAEQCWQRASFGAARYSICGVTHTTATQAVMRGMFDLRAGPQMPWDGVICTSRAVHAATLRNIELADEFLATRFGAVPERPQMPIIPLGINCASYAHDPDARARLRTRMGWEDDDVAVVTISRLVPYGKFDPGPLFLALQHAQEQLGGDKRLHFVACGLYADSHSENVFAQCARALMPDVGFHHLPGDDADLRQQTLSGGDVFAFPIDNIQETFGLSPIEAMAAGLPVVVSDWDGMRDTITADVGIAVPTRGATPAATRPEASGYLAGALSYGQYGNRLSMVTEVDPGAMARAFVTLARDPGLRAEMGARGVMRARQIYDWQAIIPQLQDFWAELAAIRRSHVLAKSDRTGPNPVGPLPMDLFSAYPGQILDPAGDRVRATGTSDRLAQVFAARRYEQIGKPAEKLETLTTALEALAIAGADGLTAEGLAQVLGWNVLTAERAILFLLKYGLAGIVSDA